MTSDAGSPTGEMAVASQGSAELELLPVAEPERSQAVRALIGQVIEQQQAEREAFRSALRVYEEETKRLTVEVAEARSELSVQIEAARREREHLVGEFLDRIDHLSSKISTSAARYEAQLAEKDVLLQDGERRVEAYAGLAADAQSAHRRASAIQRRGGSLRPSACSPGCWPSGRLPLGPRTSPDGTVASEFDPFSHNVSVIVLNYNQAAMTVECLDALAAARSELIREIIVVDNGSTPAELSILRQRHRQEDFLLVEVGINRFFGEGNNIGVDFAQGDYIVFLNNDAFVQPGWIEALCETMRSDPLGCRSRPDVPLPRRQGAGGRWHHRPDRRRRADRQGGRVGPRALRHAVPGRLLLGRLSHDAARPTSSRSAGSVSSGSPRTTRTPICV